MVLDIPGIGAVTVRRSQRAQRISIMVRPFVGVTVMLPRRAPVGTVHAAVRRHRAWLLRHIAKVQEVERSLVVTDQQTRLFRLRVVPALVDAVETLWDGAEVLISYPLGLAPTCEDVQREVRRALVAVYREEARTLLPPRVRDLAARCGFTVNRITVKNLRSRWGSCSVRGNINLSIHLMRLEDELIDYVILHELVHTRVRSHGPEFWNALDALLPGARALDRRLCTQRPWTA
jgi:predicted metal-dependent hydrolase